jgi:hypothetical protein
MSNNEQTSMETAAINSMDANPSLFAGEDLAVLIRHMADSGDYSTDDLAYAVEKPWKYESVLDEARAALGQPHD